MAWLVRDDGLTSDPRILEAIALGGLSFLFDAAVLEEEETESEAAA